jgi:hypothetical protein
VRRWLIAASATMPLGLAIEKRQHFPSVDACARPRARRLGKSKAVAGGQGRLFRVVLGAESVATTVDRKAIEATELLRLELGELNLAGFDLSLTGFGDLELKACLQW